MPQWTNLITFGRLIQSLYFDPNVVLNVGIDFDMPLAFRNVGEPYIVNTVEGIHDFSLPYYKDTVNPTNPLIPLGLPIPTFLGFNWTITNNNQSVYPIARTYAVTYMSGNMEGPPFVLPQFGTDGTLFEGDVINFTFDLSISEITAHSVNGIRLYRTVPGFDTSEQIGNPLETGFHLVSQTAIGISVPSTIGITDNIDSEQIPGDLLISDQWMPPKTPHVDINNTAFFGQTEGGWAFYGISSSQKAPSTFQFSERYMHHAWPPQHIIQIPNTVFAVTAFYDNLFIGTENVPYHVHITAGEGEVTNIDVRPFHDNYICATGSMVATNFGAMYATQDGLVALTADGDSVASRKVASPGDAIRTPAGEYTIFDTVQAAWWNGLYFGFTATLGAFVFNQPSQVNNEFPLGQLVTIDTPTGSIGPNVTNGRGLYSAWDNTLYTFPLPGYGYENVQKATYTWRSKLYVMPGLTTFAAAKVVNDNSGDLFISFIADGVLIYSRPLAHSNPFRIPHNYKAIEFEVEVTGTAVVQEIHMATSMRELTEEEGHG
jgi:hypothetical protein